MMILMMMKQVSEMREIQVKIRMLGYSWASGQGHSRLLSCQMTRVMITMMRKWICVDQVVQVSVEMQMLMARIVMLRSDMLV